MVKKAKSSLKPVKASRALMLYVPAGLVSDSTFPFSEGDEVSITIEGVKLIVKSE